MRAAAPDAGPLEVFQGLRQGAVTTQDLGAVDQITHAWFADHMRLRVQIEGPAEIRILQLDPAAADPTEVGAAKSQTAGPWFLDAELRSPFLPLLVEITRDTGPALAVVPFPSLLPGGAHGAERCAQWRQPHPLRDLWRYSRDRLRDMADPNPPAISRVAFMGGASMGGDPLEDPALPLLQDWLGMLWGHRSLSAPASLAVSAPASVPVLAQGQDHPGLTLCLGPGMVPCIGALCARQLEAGCSYLVAEPLTARPLWSVRLPQSPPNQSQSPQSHWSQSHWPQSHWSMPHPLAILPLDRDRIRDRITAPSAPPNATSRAEPHTETHDISVVVSRTAPHQTQEILRSLTEQTGVTFSEIVLAGADAPEQTGARTPHPQAVIRHAPNPIDAVQTAQAELILLISDDIALDHPAVISGLVAGLHAQEDAGSLAPVLHCDADSPGPDRWGAGLYPAQVSVLNAPHLIVAEPDCAQALPLGRVPVLANSGACCLYRKAAATAPRDSLPATDLGLGLALARAGWRSYVTTTTAVRQTQPRLPREDMDPFSLACLWPRRWDDLLNSVTLVQSLT